MQLQRALLLLVLCPLIAELLLQFLATSVLSSCSLCLASLCQKGLNSIALFGLELRDERILLLVLLLESRNLSLQSGALVIPPALQLLAFCFVALMQLLLPCRTLMDESLYQESVQIFLERKVFLRFVSEPIIFPEAFVPQSLVAPQRRDPI